METNSLENAEFAAAAGGIGIVVVAAYVVFGIISLICWIKVLIALFKKEGAGLGILGILCSIYAFVWGWLKATELGLKKTMIWWTVSIIAVFVVAGVAAVAIGATVANSSEFQKAMEEAQNRAQESYQSPDTTPDTIPDSDTDSQ